jgi:hypothetical protein
MPVSEAVPKERFMANRFEDIRSNVDLAQLAQTAGGASPVLPPAVDGANSAGSLGSLTIQQLSDLEPNVTAIGVGMSGSGTFAVP